ncbi:Uncharacterised protein [Chlamydia abortus]|nr:Uncharacterised protein [Chlamydia abortus]
MKTGSVFLFLQCPNHYIFFQLNRVCKITRNINSGSSVVIIPLPGKACSTLKIVYFHFLMVPCKRNGRLTRKRSRL